MCDVFFHIFLVSSYKCVIRVIHLLVYTNIYMILCCICLVSVSVIVPVFELVKCLLRMCSSSWIRTQVPGIQHAHRQTYRWTVEILQAHTHSHWHIHTHPWAAMPTSVRPNSLSLLLSATFIFTTTSWRIFHPACCQIFLRLGWESVRICMSVSLSDILSHFLDCLLFCLFHTISFSLGPIVVVFVLH
jgi:hypothetical protein